MENYKLVLPEHLNHYGALFGGYLLQWVDEYAWIAATRDYPGATFVTVAMDDVVFRKGVRQGAILRFLIEKAKEGRSSVSYGVTVFRDDLDTGEEERIFTTHVSFVNVDAEGKSQRLPEPNRA